MRATLIFWRSSRRWMAMRTNSSKSKYLLLIVGGKAAWQGPSLHRAVEHMYIDQPTYMCARSTHV